MSSFGLFLVMFVVLLVLVGLIRFLAWLTELQEEHGSLPRAGVHAIQRYVLVRPVKHSQDAAPVVMSRSDENTPVEPVSSKDGQSDGRTDSLVYERTELLMFYKLLRKHGIAREEARPILRAMRVPLSNDVWADAAPPDPEASPHVTPIVGRPTSARFETDPEFPYVAPSH